MKFVLYLISLLLSIGSIAQVRSVTGILKDAETNENLPFANVQMAKTRIRTVTDADGKFSLPLVDSQVSPTIIITLIGYKTDTVALNPCNKECIVLMAHAEGRLNEVVVTGVSKATLLRENPVSIISIPTKLIDQTNSDNIIDNLAQNAPGLTPVKTGPNVSKPFINGLGYNRVLTIYDGMRVETQQWGDEHGVPVDDYNISKAEIIMGPASLMYGSDALSGVVNLFPPVPNEQDGLIHGRILSEYQTNNGLVGNSIRFGYSGKHWLCSVSGSQRTAKNYQNAIDGRVYNTGFQMGNAAALIGYQGENGYSHLNFTAYDNLQGIPDGSRDSVSRKFTMQVQEIPLDDVKIRPIVPDNALNTYDLNLLHQRIEDYRLYSSNHYQIGKGEIDAFAGIEQNIRREFDHPTDPNQAGLYIRLNTLNYSLRYNVPTLYHIEPSIGINGMFQSNKNRNATDFPIPDYRLFDFGLYGYAKWKHRQLTITGGIRYDDRHLESDPFYTKINTADGFIHQVSGTDTVGSNLQFTSLSKNFNGVTASLGLAFQINEKISFKANIARGYRSPNITEIASNGLDPGAHIFYEGNRNARPEFSLQEDVGITGEFKNITAGLSAYNNNIQNYIYEAQAIDDQGNAVILVPGNKTFQYRQSNAQIYGGTAILNLHPTGLKGFTMNNSLTSTYGFNRDISYINKGVNGEYLPFIPPLKVMTWLSQEISISKGKFRNLIFGAGLEYNAAQNHYLALDHTETPTPSYTVCHASAGTAIRYYKDKKLNFQIQVNNLFNTVYQSNLNRLKYFEYFSSSPDNRLGIYDMGRNICIKIIMSF